MIETERGGYTFRTTDQGARSIEAPNGLIISDDGSAPFETAWNWCGKELPADTKYGHAWNPDPSSLSDLAIPFIDDPRASNVTKHAGKAFSEWLATADLAGDETPFELRKAWKEGRRKPVKIARVRIAAAPKT